MSRVMHVFRSILALLLCSSLAAAQQPALRLETTDRQEVKATIKYDIRMKAFAVSKWMIFLPEPPELPSQHDVKVNAVPLGKVISERSLLARKVRYLEVPVALPRAGSGMLMQLEIEATLCARKLVERKEGEKLLPVAALTQNERRYYLASSTRADFDTKVFQNWLDTKKLRLGKTESPVDFAARILEVIRTDYTYHYDPDEDKRASIACKNTKTDCGGMSYLFVGTMRASGIPARTLVGRLAFPRKSGSAPSDPAHDHPHIRTEMYLDGIGWVPVDPAFAHGNRRKPVRDYIGNDIGDMLVLHVDVDLRLPFPDKLRECQTLQIGPYYWTNGDGVFDGYIGPTGWDVKTTPIIKK